MDDVEYKRFGWMAIEMDEIKLEYIYRNINSLSVYN